ncbi:MAG TPA: BMP family ABC transporter substrate-binding protein [Candidatus Galloscillospira excrementavium]|nr:BMP family ABC transporter substrate-binding protein [Candidatus Galloscillospira excrementavium]
MPAQYYKDAQRMALKERRSCVSRGQYPYLPALDDIIPPERSAKGISLGLWQIPAEFIVGTKNATRTSAFARNFMPLLGEGSEFAAKWMQVCRWHLEEGIGDPLQVYEYMNRYYVEEGNKRCSVLKYFGAATVAARVIRVLPERTGDREVELYYELVDFWKCSGVNFIEFSRPGRYAQLQSLMGKEPGESWSEEERRNFSTVYYRFRRVYQANGGGRLASTVGDAMLACMQIYGYQALRAKDEQELKRAVASVWEEIALQQEEPPIALKLTPEDRRKSGLLSLVLPGGGHRELKVAFLYDKSPDTSAWSLAHEEGRLHVQEAFQGQIVTTPYPDVMAGDPMAAVERAIADGNTVLFTTSPRLLPVSLRAAVEHPDITILNCSLNKSHRYIRTYYARMYEAKFIIGAIAGALAGDGRLGYVCDYPIFGQIAGVNAFALGARLVNPRAEVYLEWSSVDGLPGAVGKLTGRGIDLISSQDLMRPNAEGDSFGLARLTAEGPVGLAMPVCRWGVYYETILRRILQGSFRSEYEESSKALNYYWGMTAGVVGLYCSSRLPRDTRKLAELLRQAICGGICAPFAGPIRTQGGGEVGGEREGGLSPEQIVTMDWFAENVVGSLPRYDQLSEEARATVDMVGVKLPRDGAG